MALRDGLISDFYVSFSHTHGKMISDSIWEHSQLIYDILKTNKGHMYMCGGVAGFGTKCYDALKKVVVHIDNAPPEAGDAFIDLMRKEGRCFEDLAD